MTSPRLVLAMAFAAPFLGAADRGCGSDPVATDAAAYHAAMTPLLVRNADLSREFRDLAADVKRNKTNAKDIGKMLEQDVIPTAQALARDAAAVRPATPRLVEVHGEIVQAWTDRLTAYQDLRAAWKTTDLEAFDRAADSNLDSRKREKRYLEMANQALAPYQLQFQAYPATAR